MRFWAAAIILALLVPVVAVTAANATHASHDDDHLNRGHGMITFTRTGIVSGPEKLNDHVTIVTVKETLAFTGNMSGTAHAIERDVMHNVTDDGQKIIFTTFRGSGNFTGTIGGNTVTLINIRYEGVKNSTFARGNFVVHGDTTQMNDIHGQGHFKGSLTGGVEGGGSSTVAYKMHWTVSTHADQAEARDKDDEKETE